MKGPADLFTRLLVVGRLRPLSARATERCLWAQCFVCVPPQVCIRASKSRAVCLVDRSPAHIRHAQVRMLGCWWLRRSDLGMVNCYFGQQMSLCLQSVGYGSTCLLFGLRPVPHCLGLTNDQLVLGVEPLIGDEYPPMS